MNDRVSDENAIPSGEVGEKLYKKDFWSEENLRYSKPHYRMEKAARIINKIARGRTCTLLDVGCGPATLMTLLDPKIQYHGIDIAIHNPAPFLIEADFLETPIRFGEERFDIVLAQGVFEYVGDHQNQKFAEIAELLDDAGTFVVSYVNFGHRARDIYWPYSNVQSFEDFRSDLSRHFRIRRFFPTSYNWNHQDPGRKIIKTVNMHMNINIPFAGPLAVQYFFICSPRTRGESGTQR